MLEESVIDLAHKVARPETPEDALGAIVRLRDRLDEIEEYHVENALRQGWSWSRIARALGVSKQAAHKRHAQRIKGAEGPGSPKTARARVTVTGQARRVVQLARQEAAAQGEASVGTEHVLLGLIRGTGPAAVALHAAGVSLDAARVEIAGRRRRVGPQRAYSETTISARTRRVLEQSLREAVERGEDYIGVEHLLLALLRQRGGAAVRILTDLGAAPSVVGAELRKAIDAAQVQGSA